MTDIVLCKSIVTLLISCHILSYRNLWKTSQKEKEYSLRACSGSLVLLFLPFLFFVQIITHQRVVCLTAVFNTLTAIDQTSTFYKTKLIQINFCHFVFKRHFLLNVIISVIKRSRMPIVSFAGALQSRLHMKTVTTKGIIELSIIYCCIGSL